MTTPITPAECRELTERLGIEWHRPDCGSQMVKPSAYIGVPCSCGKVSYNAKHAKKCNPDFTDARVPLRLAMKREDWQKFLMAIPTYAREIHFRTENLRGVVADIMTGIIENYVLDETGQLTKLLLEWLRGRE